MSNPPGPGAEEAAGVEEAAGSKNTASNPPELAAEAAGVEEAAGVKKKFDPLGSKKPLGYQQQKPQGSKTAADDEADPWVEAIIQ